MLNRFVTGWMTVTWRFLLDVNMITVAPSEQHWYVWKHCKSLQSLQISLNLSKSLQISPTMPPIWGYKLRCCIACRHSEFGRRRDHLYRGLHSKSGHLRDNIYRKSVQDTCREDLNVQLKSQNLSVSPQIFLIAWISIIYDLEWTNIINN